MFKRKDEKNPKIKINNLDDCPGCTLYNIVQTLVHGIRGSIVVIHEIAHCSMPIKCYSKSQSHSIFTANAMRNEETYEIIWVFCYILNNKNCF